MTVYLAIYDHKHGYDHAIFSTRENAMNWKNEIGSCYWSDVSEDDPPKMDIGDKYFEIAGELCNEWFSIEEKEVDPTIETVVIDDGILAF